MSQPTYYVKCATQEERDSLLDYAVKRGATQTGTRQPFDMEVFAMLYNTSKKWVVMSYHEVYPHEIQLTHDSFRRKVRKLWPLSYADKMMGRTKPLKVAPKAKMIADPLDERIEAMFTAIMDSLAVIRSAATFMKELDKNARQLQDMKEIGEKWDAEDAQALQPGDYTDASKEVADALTAMGFNWADDDRTNLPYIRWGMTLFSGKMVNVDNPSNNRLSPSEFLSRAAVTVKEIGLVPVVENVADVNDLVEVHGCKRTLLDGV